MRKHHFIPLLLLWGLAIITGCQKEKSEIFDNTEPRASTGHNITIAFSPGTIAIENVDSVVVDLIGALPTDYWHLTLKKMNDRFVTDSIVPEAGYNAYAIIYLRPQNNNSYAFLLHQVYGGGNEPIQKTAPKAMADDYNWSLMGRVFDRPNNFFALVGVSPSNPLLYLFTDSQKRNYIYIDKSYLDNNGQPISSNTYEYHVTTPLSHPIAIKDAFTSSASNMDGRSWSIFNSMTVAMNDQTGQENTFYFQHVK